MESSHLKGYASLCLGWVRLGFEKVKHFKKEVLDVNADVYWIAFSLFNLLTPVLYYMLVFDAEGTVYPGWVWCFWIKQMLKYYNTPIFAISYGFWEADSIILGWLSLNHKLDPMQYSPEKETYPGFQIECSPWHCT